MCGCILHHLVPGGVSESNCGLITKLKNDEKKFKTCQVIDSLHSFEESSADIANPFCSTVDTSEKALNGNASFSLVQEAVSKLGRDLQIEIMKTWRPIQLVIILCSIVSVG